MVLTICLLAVAAAVTSAACKPASGDSKVPLGTVTDYRADKSQPLGRSLPAPDFQLQMPDGKTVFIHDLRGKAVLLNFWGVNCPYCVKEMSYLQAAYDRLSASGALIIGINTGDPRKSVENFVKSKHLTFPIVLDPDIYASALYGAEYLPTNIIIDKNGNILDGQVGAYENADAVVAALSQALR
jgi:peroxiredoxin